MDKELQPEGSWLYAHMEAGDEQCPSGICLGSVKHTLGMSAGDLKLSCAGDTDCEKNPERVALQRRN